MDTELSYKFSLLSIKEEEVIKIQKWYRGSIFRLKRLPLILYIIQKYLKQEAFCFSTENGDGRINSSMDEDKIINILVKKFGNRIKKPKTRMWYDILVYDNLYKWIPVNIKITTTKSNDNVGNLAMRVYSYTDYILDVCDGKTYNNRKMSNILFNKIKDKKFNTKSKKDYYFIVLNKKDKNDVIINSIKGLEILVSNVNNLPFQICWDKNRNFIYGNINKKIKIFIKCLQNTKTHWKDDFMINIKTIKNL